MTSGPYGVCPSCQHDEHDCDGDACACMRCSGGESFDFDGWVRIGPGRYVHWATDREHDEPCLLIEYHPDARPDHAGETCGASIGFVNVDPPTGKHTLVSRDPLHVEASVLCTRCGNHGWIRGGSWTRA